MGWVVRIGVTVGLLVVAASWAGRRWNLRGGVFDVEPKLPLDRASHLRGQWAVVTGATSGLGYEVAKGLAAMDMNVIIGARSRESGEAAKKRMKQEIESNGGRGEIIVEVVDQSSFKSVESFADAVLKRTPTIASLILNAGIWANQSLTEDGISQTAQVNHYSGKQPSFQDPDCFSHSSLKGFCW